MHTVNAGIFFDIDNKLPLGHMLLNIRLASISSVTRDANATWSSRIAAAHLPQLKSWLQASVAAHYKYATRLHGSRSKIGASYQLASNQTWCVAEYRSVSHEILCTNCLDAAWWQNSSHQRSWNELFVKMYGSESTKRVISNFARCMSQWFRKPMFEKKAHHYGD